MFNEILLHDIQKLFRYFDDVTYQYHLSTNTFLLQIVTCYFNMHYTKILLTTHFCCWIFLKRF